MIESKSLNLRSRTTTFVVLKIVKKVGPIKGPVVSDCLGKILFCFEVNLSQNESLINF